MTETEKVQINFRVTKEKKKKWEDYGNEVHGSLSHFLRRAAEQEVAEGGSQASVSKDDSEDLSEIKQGMKRIEGSIDEIDRRLRNVESAVEEPAPDIRDLANEILSVLPDSREPIEDTAKGDGPLDPREQGATRVKDLSAILDEDEYLIREAIDVLEGSYMLESDDFNGSTYYWGDY